MIDRACGRPAVGIFHGSSGSTFSGAPEGEGEEGATALLMAARGSKDERILAQLLAEAERIKQAIAYDRREHEARLADAAEALSRGEEVDGLTALLLKAKAANAERAAAPPPKRIEAKPDLCGGLVRLYCRRPRASAKGLGVDFCKILEYIPSSNRLLVRAGVGWDAGVVGIATVGGDLESPAGFALRTGKPVISNHLENEERFRTSDLLKQHGIRRAMNVILQGDGKPFGVLEVDSRSEDVFLEHDLAFLQGAANILGMAIERERHDRSLAAALERHQVLLKEMNHRVKNSLSMAASMLHLQARDNVSPELTNHLKSHRGNWKTP